MKYAADFRQEARAALQGKWPLAILVGSFFKEQAIHLFFWEEPLPADLNLRSILPAAA